MLVGLFMPIAIKEKTMKYLVILLSLCIAIPLAGCSKEESAAPQKTAVQAVPQRAPGTQTALAEARETGEKVERVAQQIEEKTTAAVAQVKSSLVSGHMVYTKACLPCHKFGISGAPKVGDKKAWASRIVKGRELLVQNAIHGTGKMPPKGGNSTLTAEEVGAAVEYMLEQSR